MAELHQVVGGLLRDVAKARFASDLYSRSISRYYENSPLLRRFPVPRTEIDTVEITLKFGISGIKEELIQQESREAALGVLFERHSIAVEGRVMKSIAETVRAIISQPERNVGEFGVRIELRRAILGYWIHGRENVIDTTGKMDVDRVLVELRAVVDGALEKILRGDKGKVDSGLKAVFSTDAKDSVMQDVKNLAESLKATWGSEARQCHVDVEVGADQLSQRPVELLSSIKINAHVRNYIWTQVEAKDDLGEPWWSLNIE